MTRFNQSYGADAQGFIWDEKFGMQDLNDLVLPGHGFQLIGTARDINNKGQIVAIGFTDLANDICHAVLLDPIALEVTIEIKPGDDSNCLNLNEHGAIPVAIFGSEGFDVYEIDVASLSLQDLSLKMVGKAHRLLAHFDDIDGDGYTDLIAQFEDSDKWTSSGDGYAILAGKLYDGTPIVGRDSICIVPWSGN